MQPTSPDGEQRYAALVRAAARTVVGLDFDGTLAPIVDDPTRAHVHPDAAEVLTELARWVRAVAVVTGRPATQALELGGLEELGAAFGPETELVVLGQYGNERWSSTDRRLVSPPPPEGLVELRAALPTVLEEAGAAQAWVEEKGLAVAVHTRRLPDPRATQDRLEPALRALASAYGLVVEPGRHVLEVRGPGVHKGHAVHTLVDELGAGGILFAGDDLGDLPAYDAVAELAERGMPTLLVCSASHEQQALVERADVVVDGPDGVMALLRRLSADAAGSRDPRFRARR